MTGEATRRILNESNRHEELLCEEFGRDYDELYKVASQVATSNQGPLFLTGGCQAVPLVREIVE
jgi:hypothetical protein